MKKLLEIDPKSVPTFVNGSLQTEILEIAKRGKAVGGVEEAKKSAQRRATGVYISAKRLYDQGLIGKPHQRVWQADEKSWSWAVIFDELSA